MKGDSSPGASDLTSISARPLARKAPVSSNAYAVTATRFSIDPVRGFWTMPVIVSVSSCRASRSAISSRPTGAGDAVTAGDALEARAGTAGAFATVITTSTIVAPSSAIPAITARRLPHGDDRSGATNKAPDDEDAAAVTCSGRSSEVIRLASARGRSLTPVTLAGAGTT